MNTIKVFQRFYLAFSLVFLWVSVSFVATAHVESLLGEVVIAIAFLIAAMVLARVLIPSETLASIRDKTSGIVKFALFVNFVTSVPLLVIVSGVWKAQIAIIAGIMGVLVIAAWFFCGVAWPLASEVYRIFFGENSTTPDPLARQGRTPRYD